MFLCNGKTVSRDNKHSIHTVPFSYCESLVEPLKIHAAPVRILYKIGKTEEYYYNIVLSQRGQEKLAVKGYLMIKDKNRDDHYIIVNQLSYQYFDPVAMSVK